MLAVVSVQAVGPVDLRSLLGGLKALVQRGAGETATVLAQVLDHLAADDAETQVSTTCVG